MAVTGQDIADKAELILQDETNVRWTVNEMRLWLNSGQREICTYKPNAITKNMSVTPVQGTKQTIPADGTQFIKCVRTAAGVALTPIDMAVLNGTIPDWHATAKQNELTQHYSHDPMDPKTFYLYPGKSASPLAIDIVYCANPTDFTGTTTITGTLGATGYVDEVYEGVLLNYVLFRAYAKDSEFAGNDQKATAYYNLFLQGVGGKAKAEVTFVNPMRFTKTNNPKEPG